MIIISKGIFKSNTGTDDKINLLHKTPKPYKCNEDAIKANLPGRVHVKFGI